MIDLALDNSVVINSALEAAIQEIDILFNTNQGEMIGDIYFGSNFEQFLWDMTVEPIRIETYVTELLNANTFFLTQMPFSVSVLPMDSANPSEGAYVIEISIYNSTGDKIKTIRNILK